MNAWSFLYCVAIAFVYGFGSAMWFEITVNDVRQLDVWKAMLTSWAFGVLAFFTYAFILIRTGLIRMSDPLPVDLPTATSMTFVFCLIFYIWHKEACDAKNKKETG